MSAAAVPCKVPGMTTIICLHVANFIGSRIPGLSLYEVLWLPDLKSYCWLFHKMLLVSLVEFESSWCNLKLHVLCDFAIIWHLYIEKRLQ